MTSIIAKLVDYKKEKTLESTTLNIVYAHIVQMEVQLEGYYIFLNSLEQ